MAIGQGNPAMARAFAESRAIPFRLLTDPSQRTFKAAGMKHSLLAGMHPSVFARGLALGRQGYRQGRTQGDALQHGGAALIRPDGSVPFFQVSAIPGEHFPPEAPLAAFNALR